MAVLCSVDFLAATSFEGNTIPQDPGLFHQSQYFKKIFNSPLFFIDTTNNHLLKKYYVLNKHFIVSNNH